MSLELGLQIRDPGFPGCMRRAIALEHPKQRAQMLLRFGESALAGAGRSIELLLSEGERLRSDLVLEPQLLQAFSRGVVFVLRGLRGQRQCLLP